MFPSVNQDDADHFFLYGGIESRGVAQKIVNRSGCFRSGETSTGSDKRE
jgi:hypothetical protein